MTSETKRHRLGAMELLGVIGFSLLFSWYLTIFFWAFTLKPFEVSVSQQLISQFLMFVGLPVGFLTIRLIASRIKLNKFSETIIISCAIFSLPMPIIMMLGVNGIVAPFWAFCIDAVVTGMATSYLIVAWLDICGKTRVGNFLVFTSASLAGGSLIFFLDFLMPREIQPIVSIGFLVISVVLLVFIDFRSDTNEETVVRHRTEFFSSPREMEPLLFMFGASFGVIFVLAFNIGQDIVTLGMISILAGSVLITTVSFLKLNLSIITMLRALVVVLVAVCLVMPFATGTLQVVCICIAIGLWAVFTAMNYASLIRLVTSKNLKVLYHVSAGLIPKTGGFVAGWLLATILITGGFDNVFLTFLMLGLVFIMVLTSMVFYPNVSRHSETNDDTEEYIVQIPTVEANEELLLRVKCEAAAKQFMLSPREADVLSFLVKGRNADYIRNKLVVSPHTVKSHISSIYRKTNIHSQQKLMVFIEEFPVKTSDLERLQKN